MASGCSTVRICLRSATWRMRERERRHGKRTYYNFNIRLEATNVCVASCLFCSFARLKPGDPDSYTLSLEQVLDKLRQRADQPLTEVHVVNGLHPDLPFDYYLDMLRGLRAIRPGIHLKCFTAVEIAFFSDLYKLSDREVLEQLRLAGLDSLPGGRCRDLCAAGSPEDLARQGRRGPLPGDPPDRASDGHALQRHHALRAHRDARRARGSHAARARAAGRNRRLPGVHPARVSSRQQPDAEAAGAERRRHACGSTRLRG